jgi:hypothetical protein
VVVKKGQMVVALEDLLEAASVLPMKALQGVYMLVLVTAVGTNQVMLALMELVALAVVLLEMHLVELVEQGVTNQTS